MRPSRLAGGLVDATFANMSRDVELGILFADLAGYTALTEAHGDDDAANVAARFYLLARQSLRGPTRFVKPIGDAVMLAGPAPTLLLESLLRLRAAIDAEPDYPAMRAGLHVGPVVERDGDVFGATVNVAARVAAYSRSGQTLCTARFRDALGNCPWVALAPLGPVRLKNVLDPVELFEVSDAGAPISVYAVDPVCRMRVPAGVSSFHCESGDRVVVFCSASCRDAFLAAPDRYVNEAD